MRLLLIIVTLTLHLLLLLATDGMAQNYRAYINTYGEEEGLNVRTITEIIQDSTGFLWLSTDAGLYRFDGYRFETVLPEKPTNGVALFNSKMGITTTVSEVFTFSVNELNAHKLAITDTANIYWAKPISDSTFLLATTHTLWHCSLKGEKKLLLNLKEYPEYSEPFSNVTFHKVYVKSSNEIWLIAGNLGTIVIDNDGNILHHYKTLIAERDGFYFEDTTGIWYSLDYNFLREKKGTQQFQPYSFPKVRTSYVMDQSMKGVFLSQDKKAVNLKTTPSFRRIAKDKKGLYYLFLEEADVLYLFDEAKGTVEELRFETNEFVGVDRVLVDNHGVLWFNSAGKLKSLKVERLGFQTYFHQSPQLNGSSPSTRAIWEEENNIYINSYSGLLSINKQTNEEKLESDYTVDFSFGEELNYGFPKLNLYRTLQEQGVNWFTSDAFGLFKYDKRQKNFKQFVPKSEGWFNSFSLHRMTATTLLMGGTNGIYLVDETSGYIIPIENQLKGKINVYEIYPYKEVLLLGTNKGVYQYDRESGQVRLWQAGNKWLSESFILAFHETKRALWLATKGNGLLKIDTENLSSVKQYSQATYQFPDDRICSILEENDSILWMGSFNGLMRFNKNSGKVSSFFTEDGLTDNEFNHSSAYKTKDGKMYFGGVKGINAFYPKDLFKEKSNAQVLLSELKLFDTSENEFREVSTPEIEEKVLNLSPDIDLLVINFSLNDFSNPTTNEYAYQLDDGRNYWQELGTQNQLTFPVPKPGKYILKIRGKGSDGLWSDDYLEIQFFVETPWYKHTLFYVFLILIFTVSIFLFNALRVRNLEKAKKRLEIQVKQRTHEIASQKEQIEKQAEELQALDKIKSRFFTNISHELKTPLTLILGYADYLSEETKVNSSELLKKGLEATASNAKLLLKLIEEIMALSKLEAGKLELNYTKIDVNRFLKGFIETFTPLLNQKHIIFSFDCNVKENLYVELDASKVEKILLNLISNAIKFTSKGGTIKFSVIQKENKFKFIVEDTGRGVHPNDLSYIFDRYYQSKQKNAPTEGGTGVGLALVKELVELMNGEIHVESRLNKGSKFTVMLPLTITQATKIFENEEEYLLSKSIESLLVEDDKKIVSTQKEKTLLIVEDNNQMREFISTLLSNRYFIVEANDGEEGLKKIEDKQPDLIISDIMMPNMDGYEMLERLKANERTKWIPTIMLTARSSDEDKIKAFQIGVNEYMLKPFNATELKVRVANMLRFSYERTSATENEKSKHAKPVTVEQQFVENVRQIIYNNIAQNDFNIEKLAKEVAMSSKTLTRKLKPVTGFTPLQFINEVRLQEARKMLENKQKATVSEVMYAVGFQSGGYFSKAFLSRFGKTPKQYLDV